MTGIFIRLRSWPLMSSLMPIKPVAIIRLRFQRVHLTHTAHFSCSPTQVSGVVGTQPLIHEPRRVTEYHAACVDISMHSDLQRVLLFSHAQVSSVVETQPLIQEPRRVTEYYAAGENAHG